MNRLRRPKWRVIWKDGGQTVMLPKRAMEEILAVQGDRVRCAVQVQGWRLGRRLLPGHGPA